MNYRVIESTSRQIKTQSRLFSRLIKTYIIFIELKTKIILNTKFKKSHNIFIVNFSAIIYKNIVYNNYFKL